MNKKKRSTIYIDMRKLPITFDLCYFLYYGITYCKSRADSVDIIIMKDSYRNVTPRERLMSKSERFWRLHNIVLKLCTLLINHKITINYTDRERISEIDEICWPPGFSLESDAKDFPLFYSPILMNHQEFKAKKLDIFSAGTKAQNWAKEILGSKSVIFCSRKSDWDQQRNTPASLFEPSLNFLKRQGYLILEIPDQDYSLTRTADDKLSTPAVLASIDVEMRLALYENATFILGTSGGNVAPAIFSNCNFLIFGILNNSSIVSNNNYFMKRNITPGEPIKWLPKNKKYDWTDLNNLNQTIIQKNVEQFILENHFL